MNTPLNSSETHWVEHFTLAIGHVGKLRALDYENKPLGSLSYGEIEVAGESPDHKWRVLDAIRRNGVQIPALVMVRDPSESMTLVEGHHRAVASIDLGRHLPVELHHCQCSLDSLDYFGLCPTILEACRIQKTRKNEND